MVVRCGHVACARQREAARGCQAKHVGCKAPARRVAARSLPGDPAMQALLKQRARSCVAVAAYSWFQ